MSELVINGRFSLQEMTGIQRVGQAITARLRTPHVIIGPKSSGGGMAGHAWEQTILPLKAGGRLIWSSGNMGPIMAGSQIVTIHDVAAIDHPEWFSPNFVRLYGSLWPVLARRAKQIVTVSHFSKERISEVLNIPRSKIEVVWNGVSESFKPASRPAIESATASLGLAGRPYFRHALYYRAAQKSEARHAGLGSCEALASAGYGFAGDRVDRFRSRLWHSGHARVGRH
jgi:hypothetical protein